MASVLAERPPWLAHLPTSDGDGVVGAGVLIDDQHVLTCAHVVAAQSGEPADIAGAGRTAPGGEVRVEFPFAATEALRRARVAGWQPIEPDGSGDVALLRLDEPVSLAAAAPLAAPPTLWGDPFSVHGFPQGDRAARHARSVLGGASGPAGEWVQIEAVRTTGWPVEGGFSGAPVFDHRVGAVVGIVVLRDDHRSAHLLPVSYLRTLWPAVNIRVGWRLDLDTHWLPRARGSEIEADSGQWYFTGRIEARQAICDWLADEDQATALVVVGGPGTGKSALLAHVVVAADPMLGDTVPTDGPRPPSGSFQAAIHAKGLTADDVVERLAAAAGVAADTAPALLASLRGAGTRLTIVVDAIEEAASLAEARQIASMLRQLSEARVARVLASLRTALAGTEQARVLAALGGTTRVDLESARFLRRDDVTEYVSRRLVGDKTSPGRYRDTPAGELGEIAAAVAAKAGYNFLIAQLASRWLTQPATPPLDIGQPAWQGVLPVTIGQAMDAYLDTCGPDIALVRRLLTALAFARGDGLTRILHGVAGCS